MEAIKWSELEKLPKYTGPCKGCTNYNEVDEAPWSFCNWDAEQRVNVIDCMLRNVGDVLLNQ
jgi:hypothetical protein